MTTFCIAFYQSNLSKVAGTRLNPADLLFLHTDWKRQHFRVWLLFDHTVSSVYNLYTDKKWSKIFLLYIGNSDRIGCKVIYEEGLPNIWGNTQIFTIYEEAFSHIYSMRKIFFFFIRVPCFTPFGNVRFLDSSLNLIFLPYLVFT